MQILSNIPVLKYPVWSNSELVTGNNISSGKSDFRRQLYCRDARVLYPSRLWVRVATVLQLWEEDMVDASFSNSLIQTFFFFFPWGSS